MAANRASSTATNPGMAAPGRGLNLASRTRAETYATTKPTSNARTPLSSWVGETLRPGGIAAACSQGGSWPGRRFRSPKSSDQDDGNEPSGLGRTSYENVVKPCRALRLSLSCQLRCCVALPARQCRKPRQAPRFPASRSKSRSKRQGRNSRRSRHEGPAGWCTEADHRDPLKRRPGRRRMRRVPSCGSLPGSRERPAVATTVVNQAGNTARSPGLGAASRRGITRFSRQRAKTRSPTRATSSADKPRCSWAGTDNAPGGIATACRSEGNSGLPQPINGGQGSRSPRPKSRARRACASASRPSSAAARHPRPQAGATPPH